VEALLIMIIGMGGVLIFLTVLVGIMHLITNLAPHVEPPKAPVSAAPTVAGQAQLVAVIQAAIHRYRTDTAR
jgi:sodium pump decarboxylase gamma subunit